MATVLLAAAGGAIGGSIGGSVLGVSAVAIGKAVGATVGAVIDQRILGAGSDSVEIGRRDRLRITGSREGAPVQRVWGQMRLGGQIIWSSNFREDVTVTGGGGKGAPSGPTREEYSYSVSLAIALAEGEVTRIGRIWADGQVVAHDTLNLRFYPGSETQLPDPLIAASLPEGEAPAYRGIAYVVIEDLDLSRYGNRIPQFSFEAIRAAADAEGEMFDPIRNVRAVALVPGTGEYALATEPVRFEIDKGETRVANVNNDQGAPDAVVALDNLAAEVPACEAVSLVVSWFGDDLRCSSCTIRPKVEQKTLETADMPWSVAGLDRAAAELVGYVDGRPGFGGTPTDASVVQTLQKLKADGRAAMFYPFVLMDIRAGNGLPDPWTGAGDQPEVPWRGRITGSAAPGQAGSPDKTPAAASEVAAFFGSAAVSDFQISGGDVIYSGPDEWSYRRFILHYAHLCAAAGGVEAFCIGSELRSLTQLRDGPGSFPAVQALRQLAQDVRSVLGPDTKIGYAADWSEYFGYHPADGSGDVYYHLDDLWADPAIDFIGIDNYMPLSDWRDGKAHADAGYGSIYDLDYLKANIAGGEGYDWYYPGVEARDAQLRYPIEDGAYNDPWVFRYKDILNWWSRPHWNRPGGVRDIATTAWEAESKPIWFTELGCPAVDKGTNQPNVFLDPQSSESDFPHYSTGGRDDYIQLRYLEAMQQFWADGANNPVSRVYDAPMVDVSRAFVWAWDARPWPDFPRRLDVWSDGLNHGRGHWISGRAQRVRLADAVTEICARAGLEAIEASALHGSLQGYLVDETETARESLQPLMLAYGFDSFERDGQVVFRNRHGDAAQAIATESLAIATGTDRRYEVSRAPEAEVPARVRVSFIHPEKDYQTVSAAAQLPAAEELYSAGSDLPVALSHAEGEAVAARWLAESQIARDGVNFALPRSTMDLGPGDVVELDLPGRRGAYRIDRVEETEARLIEAVRVEPGVYAPRAVVPELVRRGAAQVPGQPYVEVMDLPLLTGQELPHAPHVAAARTPWGGPLAIYSSADDYGYVPNGEITRASIVGTTLTALEAATPGRWAEQSLELRVASGELESRSALNVLNGANAAALRFGGSGDWEVIQFRDAELIGPDIYRLTGLLRGQAGTEPVIPALWPAGTDFVRLDGAAVQPEMAVSALGLERYYRVGPAERAYDDPAYRAVQATVRGVGLRPYAPVHVVARPGAGGDVDLAWVRRTRLGGDNWQLAEVPLSEAQERYELRIESGGQLLRSVELGSTGFTYTAAMQAADGATLPLTFLIAQISDLFGPGLQARITYNG